MDSLEEIIQTMEETKLTSLTNDLHHYKPQNTHLNNLNDHLVNDNHMIRKYLEEINSNYAELVQVAEEAFKIRKMAQETNDKLLKQNQELQENVPAIEKEISPLRRRSHALYGLTMLTKVAHKL